jgi:dTDP-4-dehydrorhamnose reductase
LLHELCRALIDGDLAQLASTFSIEKTHGAELTVMRILVTGASGRLGTNVMARLALADRKHTVVGWGHRKTTGPGVGSLDLVDLADSALIATALERFDPDVVIHLAAITSAEVVHRDPQAAWMINVEATGHLAQWLAQRNGRLVFASTDLVFDGTKSFYREEDRPKPILEYGRTKHAAELLVRRSARSLIARISLLYGFAPPGREGFFDRSIASLHAGISTEFFADEYRTPLDYCTAATALVALAKSDITGVIHLGGPERLSRFELMRRVAATMGISPSLVHSGSPAHHALAEARPTDVSLDSSRLRNAFPELNFPSIEAILG